MSATEASQSVDRWHCGCCRSTDPPRVERWVTFAGRQYLKVACQRCGYPELAEILGGVSP